MTNFGTNLAAMVARCHVEYMKQINAGVFWHNAGEHIRVRIHLTQAEQKVKPSFCSKVENYSPGL